MLNILRGMCLLLGSLAVLLAASAATGVLGTYVSWTPISSAVGGAARSIRPVLARTPVGRAPQIPPGGYSLPEPHASHSVIWDKVDGVETDVYSWEWLTNYDLQCSGGNLAAATLRTQVVASLGVWLLALSVRPLGLGTSWRAVAKATAVAAALSCWIPAGVVAAWIFWYVADTYTTDLLQPGFAHEPRIDLFRHGIDGLRFAGTATRVAITVWALWWFRQTRVASTGGAPIEGRRDKSGWPKVGVAAVILGLLALWCWPYTYTWVRWVFPGLPD